jgi:hypothetical protein
MYGGGGAGLDISLCRTPPTSESARRMRAVAEISRPTPREWEKEKQNMLGERVQ